MRKLLLVTMIGLITSSLAWGESVVHCKLYPNGQSDSLMGTLSISTDIDDINLKPQTCFDDKKICLVAFNENNKTTIVLEATDQNNLNLRSILSIEHIGLETVDPNMEYYLSIKFSTENKIIEAICNIQNN
ncbi:MAG: hypothetical protein A2381_16340 [Bdellovibrionales bacterium RIFOXYB1_FULL_37_110]|nr:MAG: hypothetical protein A2181_06440 [Bdellovibrionales bacterium RIFOXYA1_FULL_38_20]OFZ48511.1 MAG: hypothetical protein A2417_04200 [Bdellovibrionales bacterium RIFOXYC1_FULL_37_79]OFZ57190.1 MAG: hypothetical protein A2381_16340 [Bdellovibrionales bacterium RIFOXYB1_FULL_37_110]OFZ63169.1 MAG: hypothetical protein A2577_15840 [Bdellovibrionales bacterium RIFOXYD1_FULL_36_51]